MAVSLAAASLPAEATNKGLSEKQIRALIKQEVAKLPRVRGPKGDADPAGPPGPQGATGPTGPAGMDGLPSLFAHVNLAGHVDDGNPLSASGITNENVRRVEKERELQDGRVVLDITYCFVGLPPAVGGQVTITDGGSRGLASPRLNIDTQDPECPIMVTIVDELGVDPDELVRTGANFYILLY